MGVESIEIKPTEVSTIKEVDTRIGESREAVEEFKKENPKGSSDNLNGSRAWEDLRRRYGDRT